MNEKNSGRTEVYKTEVENFNPFSQKQAAICNSVSTIPGFGWLVAFSVEA